MKNRNNWPDWKKKRTAQIIRRCITTTLITLVVAVKLIAGVGYAEPNTGSYIESLTEDTIYHSHYVTSGETLWDIAEQYCTDDVDIREYIDVICTINGIRNQNDIMYGTNIIVPCCER